VERRGRFRPHRGAQGSSLRHRGRGRAARGRPGAGACRADHACAEGPRARRRDSGQGEAPSRLDEDESWIVLDEANEFVWPGPDLRPVAREKAGVWTFGVLPQELFAELQAKLAAVLQRRRILRSE
jgi:hypothetical protein